MMRRRKAVKREPLSEMHLQGVVSRRDLRWMRGLAEEGTAGDERTGTAGGREDWWQRRALQVCVRLGGIGSLRRDGADLR